MCECQAPAVGWGQGAGAHTGRAKQRLPGYDFTPGGHERGIGRQGSPAVWHAADACTHTCIVCTCLHCVYMHALFGRLCPQASLALATTMCSATPPLWDDPWPWPPCPVQPPSFPGPGPHMPSRHAPGPHGRPRYGRVCVQRGGGDPDAQQGCARHVRLQERCGLGWGGVGVGVDASHVMTPPTSWPRAKRDQHRTTQLQGRCREARGGTPMTSPPTHVPARHVPCGGRPRRRGPPAPRVPTSSGPTCNAVMQ